MFYFQAFITWQGAEKRRKLKRRLELEMEELLHEYSTVREDIPAGFSGDSALFSEKHSKSHEDVWDEYLEAPSDNIPLENSEDDKLKNVSSEADESINAEPSPPQPSSEWEKLPNSAMVRYWYRPNGTAVISQWVNLTKIPTSRYRFYKKYVEVIHEAEDFAEETDNWDDGGCDHCDNSEELY